MINFPDFETESMGGCVSFQFSPINYVHSLPATSQQSISSPVLFKAGYAWLNGIAIRDSLRFSETSEKTPSGIKYKTQISGMIPKLTPEYMDLFEEMKRHKHLLLIVDNNAKKRLAGNLRAGMAFIYSQDSGQSPSGLSGFSFSFSLEYIKPTPYYTL